MFDLFRSREKSVRILLGALLLLVAASMLVYLIPGGVGGPNATGENIVAAVGDQKVTAADVQRAIQNMTRGQANLPRGVLAMYVPTIVDQLVEAKAMAYKARQMGLRISNQELGDTIQAEFAAQLGGKFDMQIYRMYLGQQGLTAPQFEEQQREALLVSRLEDLERQSIVVSDEDARAEYQRKNLKVGLQYLAFEGKNFASKVNKDPAAVKAYFSKNRSLFRTPEKRNVDLIVGVTADYMQTAQVSDQELQKDYQDNIDSYRTPERVRLRHILIKTQGKPKEEVPKLKAKAEDILKQLKAGTDFATLAKKNSEDPGSAEKGGELGWVVKGQMVAAFEKAAFSVPVGELSGIVETEYGYHILQVEEKQAARTQTFDEAKPQLLADAKKQLATENLRKAIEKARDEIIRNPSQAQSVAAKYNLRFFKVDNMTTNTTLPEVGSQQQLSNTIFSTAKGGTTDVIDMDSQGKQAFATIVNLQPAHDAEFAEVENDVLQHYITAESERLAGEAGKAAAERARKKESLEAVGKDYGLTLKTAAAFTIDGAAEGIGSASQLAAAFQANVGDIVGPVTGSSGEFVCEVSQKIPADMSQFAANKKATVQSIQQRRQQLQIPLFRDSLVADLKRHGKIKVNEAAISRIVGSFQS